MSTVVNLLLIPVIWFNSFLLMHVLITVIYRSHSRSGNIVCIVHNLLHLWETSSVLFHTIIYKFCNFFDCLLFGALHVSMCLPTGDKLVESTLFQCHLSTYCDVESRWKIHWIWKSSQCKLLFWGWNFNDRIMSSW